MFSHSHLPIVYVVVQPRVVGRRCLEQKLPQVVHEATLHLVYAHTLLEMMIQKGYVIGSARKKRLNAREKPKLQRVRSQKLQTREMPEAANA